MGRPSLLHRPLAALAAGLLVAGLVQAAPAAADEPPAAAAVAISVFPSPELPFNPGPGKSPDQPAQLGRMPAGVPLRASISNVGGEALKDFSVTNTDATTGATSTVACDYNPEGGPAEPGTVPPGMFATCMGFGPAGVMDDKVNDNVTTVTARGAQSGSEVSATAHYYSIAEDDSVKVGDRVWLDTDRDGVQDAGEPGIGGVGLTITGPDGSAAPDFISRDGVVGPQVTADDGSYLFKHLFPLDFGNRYTVTVDRSSPALKGLKPTASGVGSPATDSSAWTGLSSDSLDSTGTQDTSVDFGFVSAEPPPVTPPAKATVALVGTVSPSVVTKGSTATVSGTIARDGKPFATTAALEFRADGSAAWTKVKDVSSDTDGDVTAKVVAGVSGSYRLRFAGDSTTAQGTSAEIRLTVRKLRAQLTIKLPGTAIVGTTVKVTGSITKEGRAFRTSTTLERRVGSGSWSKVKNVKSSSKGGLATTVKADRSADYRFRYTGDTATDPATSPADHVVVRKATIKLAVSAPGSVTKGKSIKVKGSVRREGKKYRATTVLEFRADSASGWSKVKKVRSSKKGSLSTSVKPSRSGEYRYRFAGNSTTAAGASGGDHVTVKPKPPAKPKPRAFKNCTALNKVYPHGVGRSGARDKVRGSTDPVTDFVRDTATYKKNTKSDRDKDGIACERH